MSLEDPTKISIAETNHPALEGTSFLSNHRSSQFLYLGDLETTESTRGHALFYFGLKAKVLDTISCASWDLKPSPRTQQETLHLRVLSPQPLPGMTLRNNGESNKDHKYRVESELFTDDAKQYYWLLSYLKEELLSPDSHLNKIITSANNASIPVMIEAGNFMPDKPGIKIRVIFDAQPLTAEYVSDCISRIQLAQARDAMGLEFRSRMIPFGDILKVEPVVYQDGNDAVIRVIGANHNGSNRFPSGTLVEPLTGVVLGEFKPQFCIANITNFSRGLCGHYGEPGVPEGFSIDEINKQIAEIYSLAPLHPVAKPSKTKSALPPVEKIDYIQLAVDAEVEDASYLLKTPDLLPKNKDGKLSWQDKSMERKEVKDPASGKSIGFIYRSVVLDNDSLSFKFFKTRGEAANARISNKQLKELIDRLTNEHLKSPLQKNLEKLGTNKDLSSIKDNIFAQITSAEDNKQLPINSKSAQISQLGLQWHSSEDELYNMTFTNRVRMLITDPNELSATIKYAREFESSFTRLKDLPSSGDLCIDNVLLLQSILNAAAKICDTQQASQIIAIKDKIERAFNHKFSKAGPWAKTQVPLIKELTDLRVMYALPELTN